MSDVEIDVNRLRRALDAVPTLTARSYVDRGELGRLALALAHIHYETFGIQRGVERLVAGGIDDETYLEIEADLRTAFFEIVTHIVDTRTLRDVVTYLDPPDVP